jgi:hypothetical protein
MPNAFATNLTGGLFLAAALMLWGGWVLLPRRLGTFFRPEDFPAVHRRLRLWLWLYRVHLFGMVTAVMALVALGAALTDSQVRVLAWPGAAVAAAGLVVGAIGSAFYYHFGVWGALAMHGKAPDLVAGFVDSLHLSTEYVTCLVRFSRVFTGLGLLVLALGLLHGQVLPWWVGLSAAGLGVAAMALTMGLPDRLELYAPLFHLQALWLVATGVVVLLGGMRLDPASGL